MSFLSEMSCFVVLYYMSVMLLIICVVCLFQIWMCGGQMVDAPCSRVGHIYRKFAPFPNPQKGDFVGRVRCPPSITYGL